jgi:hypothetical protein
MAIASAAAVPPIPETSEASLTADHNAQTAAARANEQAAENRAAAQRDQEEINLQRIRQQAIDAAEAAQTGADAHAHLVDRTA